MLHDPVVHQIFQQALQTAVYTAHIETNQLLWPSYPAEKEIYESGISLQLYVLYETKGQRSRTYKNETNTPYIVNYVVYCVSKLLRGESVS